MRIKAFIAIALISIFTLSFIGCSSEDTSQNEYNSSDAVSKESNENSEEISEESSEEIFDDAKVKEVVYNQTTTNESVPYYFQDFSKSKTVDKLADQSGVKTKYVEDGYVRCTNTKANASFKLPAATFYSQYMRYILIEYKADSNVNAEIRVKRSGGKDIGDDGTTVSFSLESSAEFKRAVIDVSSICKEGERFTKIVFSPADQKGAVVDIKYIGGFETKEGAEGFDYDLYVKKRINSADEDLWEDPVYVEQTVTAEDNYAGTLDMKENEDGTVTISYVQNGETVCYTVPNNVNYLSGGFAAVDDVNRTVPDSSEVGIYGENGEYYVGLFYFLWMGEHGDQGVYDINKIVARLGMKARYLACGAWGPEQGWHFWGEPLYGYYFSDDEWVIRKHMELLSNANIDFLYFDVTNGYPYISNAKKVMKVCHELNAQGYDAPQVVFYTHSDSTATVKQIYEDIYKKEYYPDTWFYVDGKPVIVAYEEDNIDNFFTIRLPQWPNEPANTAPSWPWMDFEWPQRVFKDSQGVGEAISVSVAQHSGSIRFSSSALYEDTSNRGRTTVGSSEYYSQYEVKDGSYVYGRNFQAQWDRVFQCIEQSAENKEENIKYVLVTGWNEWVAQRQSSTAISGEQIFFVDLCSPEYSRDTEMSRGLYFDNYYLQLLENVYKLKGAAPVLIQDSRKAINVTGDFSQWDSVKVTYTDPENDCNDRFSRGFGRTPYVNQTGRNDIVSAKVTSDTKNLYFYVKTQGNISMFDTDSSWMQLFINTDGDGKNGWYGYDYIINNNALDMFTTTVAKNTEEGKFAFEDCGEISYRVKGNEMMIAVPLEMLGIDDYTNINVEFKWADSVVEITNAEAFYELGDCAPLGRLNWIYRNK